MKKRFSVLALSLSMLIFLNSCGVMFGGSRYQGTIVAKDHPNAQIYVDGQKMGSGQVTALFPRNKELVVEMKEDGCDTVYSSHDVPLIPVMMCHKIMS